MTTLEKAKEIIKQNGGCDGFGCYGSFEEKKCPCLKDDGGCGETSTTALEIANEYVLNFYAPLPEDTTMTEDFYERTSNQSAAQQISVRRTI